MYALDMTHTNSVLATQRHCQLITSNSIRIVARESRRNTNLLLSMMYILKFLYHKRVSSDDSFSVLHSKSTFFSENVIFYSIICDKNSKKKTIIRRFKFNLACNCGIAIGSKIKILCEILRFNYYFSYTN